MWKLEYISEDVKKRYLFFKQNLPDGEEHILGWTVCRRDDESLLGTVSIIPERLLAMVTRLNPEAKKEMKLELGGVHEVDLFLGLVIVSLANFSV